MRLSGPRSRPTTFFFFSGSAGNRVISYVNMQHEVLTCDWDNKHWNTFQTKCQSHHVIYVCVHVYLAFSSLIYQESLAQFLACIQGYVPQISIRTPFILFHLFSKTLRNYASSRVDFFLNLWFESASEPYQLSNRRLSAKLVPTFVDRGCHVVSVTDP
jgi:hypothetical protein